MLRTALPEPFPRLVFELHVEFAFNDFHEFSHGPQKGKGLFGVAAGFDNEPGEMFFGFRVSSRRDEKRHVLTVHLPHSLPKDSPNENIGINDQGLTWHSGASRGQPAGCLYSPPSTRFRWRPRTRSFCPGLSRRHASHRVRRAGFAFVPGYSSRASVRAGRSLTECPTPGSPRAFHEIHVLRP